MLVDTHLEASVIKQNFITNNTCQLCQKIPAYTLCFKNQTHYIFK